MNKETLDHLELCIFAEQTHDVNFQNIAKELFREVYLQKSEVERLNNILKELENGLKEEIDRLEKVALENKNNKFEFDRLVLIRGKIMDIYYELKELKGGK